MRRVIGRDNRLNQASQNIGIAGQRLQEATNTLNITNNRAAELSAQLTQDAISSNNAVTESIMATSQANQAGARSKLQGMEQFIKGLSSVDQVIQQRAQQALEQRLNKQKQLEQIETAQAFVEMQQLVSNAPQYINSTSPDNYEQQMHKIVSKYANISPEGAQKIFGEGYTALEQVNKQNFQKTQEGIDQINNALTSQKKQELILKTGGILSRLEKSFGNPQPFIDEFDKELNNFFNQNPNLSPLQAVQLTTTAFEELAKSTRLNDVQRAEVERKLTGSYNFLNQARQAYAQYSDSPELYQTKLYQLAAENDIPYDTALKIADPNQGLKTLRDHLQLQQEVRDLQQNNLLRDFNNQRFNDKYVGYTALLIMNDPQFKASIEANPTSKNNVLYKTAFAVADELSKYEELNRKNSREVQSLQQQLAAWNGTTSKFIAGNGASGQNPMDLIAKFIDLNAASGDTDFIARLEALNSSVPPNPGNPSFTPEQRQQALEQWQQWRQAGAQAINNQISLRQRELQTQANKLERYGILGLDLTDPSVLERVKGEYDALAGEIKAISQQAPQGGVLRGQNGNFNRGDNAPVVNPAFKKITSSLGTQITLPFRPDAEVSISSGYGQPGTGRHGRNRNHGGLDIAAPAGTPIISPVHGEIVNIDLNPNNPTHYGIYMDVKDDATGRIHRFAHMQGSWVQKGDRVTLGQPVGKVGNTGRSTGAHLHWEIRTSVGGRFESTLDVEHLAAELNVDGSITKPRGDNRDWMHNAPNPYVPNQESRSQFANEALPNNALPLKGGLAVLDGLVYSNGNPVGDVTTTYTNSNVMRNSFVNYDLKGFDPKVHNNPDQNHGYAELARNPSKAAKIAEVATRLGIPAIWLADVIAFESGFRPDIDNGYDDDGDGHGYVGLIQFGAAAAKDLGTSPQELKNMDFNTQMEYVYRYLNQPQFRGQLKTVQHTLAAVFGGRGLINKLNKNPSSAYGTGDINISFGNYLKKLGKDAGRQYEIPGLTARRNRASTPIHESYVAGCSVCNALKAANSNIVPHEAQA